MNIHKNNSIIWVTSLLFYFFGVILYENISRDNKIVLEHYNNYYFINLNYNNYELINIFIFNNIKLILLLILGSFTFGIVTIQNLIFNGFILGYVLKESSNQIGLFSTLSLILPHGIFEIPAMIIAGAAGFKIPYEIVRYLLGKKEVILTKEDIREYITLAFISIILITIAAFVEAYITPKIAEMFLKDA